MLEHYLKEFDLEFNKEKYTFKIQNNESSGVYFQDHQNKLVKLEHTVSC